MATRDAVLDALKTIKDPGGEDIVSAGVVRALNVDDGAVRFVMEIAPSEAKAYEVIKAEAEKALGQLGGVEKVSIVLTGRGAAPLET